MKYTPKLCLFLALALVFITAVMSYDLTFGGPAVFESINTVSFTLKSRLAKGATITYGSTTNCNLFKDDVDDEDFLSNDGKLCTLVDSNHPIAEIEIAKEQDKEEDSCDEIETGKTKLFTIKALRDIPSGSTIICKAKISKVARVGGLPVVYRIDEGQTTTLTSTYPSFAAVTVTDVEFKEKDADYTLSFRTNKVGPLKIVPSCADIDDDDRKCTIATDSVYCDGNNARLFSTGDKTYIYVQNPDKKITCKFNFWSVTKINDVVSIAFDDVPGLVTKNLDLKIPKGSIQSHAQTYIVRPDALLLPSKRVFKISLFTPSIQISKGTTLHLTFSASESDVDISKFISSVTFNPDSDYDGKISATKDGFDLTYKRAVPPPSFQTVVSFTQDLAEASPLEYDLKIKVTDVRDKVLSDVKNGLKVFIRSYFKIDDFKAEFVGTKEQQLKLTMTWKPLIANVSNKWFALFRFDKNVNSNDYDCDVEIAGAKVDSSSKYYYGDLIVSSDVDVDVDRQVTVTCYTEINREVGENKKITVYAGGDIVGNVDTQDSFDITSHKVQLTPSKTEYVPGTSFKVQFATRIDYSYNRAKQSIFQSIKSFFSDEENAATLINQKIDAFLAKLKTIKSLEDYNRDTFAYLAYDIDQDEYDVIAPFEVPKEHIIYRSGLTVTISLAVNGVLSDGMVEEIQALFPKSSDHVVIDFTKNDAFIVSDFKADKELPKACFGRKTFGVPGCAQQLPGASCNHHAQCFKGSCYDKKCQAYSPYAPYANSANGFATTLATIVIALALFILV